MKTQMSSRAGWSKNLTYSSVIFSLFLSSTAKALRFDSRQTQQICPLPDLQTGVGDHEASYSVGLGALMLRHRERYVKLPAYHHLVPRLRMRGDTLPLSPSGA
jgi:hypothetical protein